MSLHKHHRLRRSQGGTDDPVNILEVTPEIHDWIHRNPEQAYELGWLVHSYDDPAQVSVKLPEMLTVKKPRERKKAPENPRAKKRYLVHVPADEENVLPELADALREKYAEKMGWQEDVPDYFCWALAGALALQQD